MVVSIIGYGTALLSIFLGICVLYYSYLMFKQYQLIRDLPISTVQSLPVGYVEVQGAVRLSSDSNLFIHPITGEETVFYQRMLTRQVGSDFNLLENEIVGDSFLVDDGTGQVEVVVDNPRLDFDADHVVSQECQLKPDENAPDFLQPYHQSVASSDLPEDETEVRYEEMIYSLEPNETVLVFGESKIRDGVASATNEENLVIKNPDSRNPILSSVLPPQARGINGVLSSRGLPQIISTREDEEFVEIAQTVIPTASLVGVGLFIVALWFFIAFTP